MQYMHTNAYMNKSHTYEENMQGFAVMMHAG